MTENKRFELAYEKGNWWAVRDGDITLWKEEVIHLLNELSEENEHLKSRVDYLGRKIERERNSIHKQYAKWEKEAEKKIKELAEENEQLKQHNTELINKIDFLERIIDGMLK